MKVAWKYSENIKSSKPLYKNEKFKEMADMFNQYGSQIDFWPKIKSFTVASFMAKNGWLKLDSELLLDLSSFYKKYGMNVRLKTSPQMNTDYLETPAKMYVHLYTNLRELWRTSLDFFRASFTQPSMTSNLLLTSNYDPQNYFQESVKKILLEFIADRLGFEFINIDNLSFLNKVHNNKSITGTG